MTLQHVAAEAVQSSGGASPDLTQPPAARQPWSPQAQPQVCPLKIPFSVGSREKRLQQQ